MLRPSQEPVPQLVQAPGALEQGVPASGRAAGHPAGASGVQVSTVSPSTHQHLPSG
jgi:hypothetical protein